MGQKVHPYGFRIGFNKTWKSRWFADKDYAKLLHEDLALRQNLKKRFQHAGVAKDRDRARREQAEDRHPHLAPGHHHRPQGTEVDKLKQEIQKRTNREVFINIQEIQKPELDAQLIGESVAMQLEKRVAFRRAMRKAVESALRFGARGIKVRVSGPLNGAEIARSEWYLHGQLPLQTLRADIDYGFAEANTTYGQIGVKVWLYKGERLTPRVGPREEYGGDRGDRARSCRPARRAVDRRKRLRNDIMLMPKKVKYRKQQRGRMTGKAWRGSDVSFGDYGLKAMEPCWMTDAADRSGARGDDTLHQAWRQDLGSRVPGQADHEEAAGNAHGQGQGRARGLGVRDQAGPHPVRDGRRDRGRSASRDGAGRRPSCPSRRSSRRGSPRRRCHEGRGS